MTAGIVIRPCFQHDLDQARLIYGHHVMTGTGTFDTEQPTQSAFVDRWANVVGRGFPFLVATPERDAARVLGFAYVQPFRDRPAYARTVEDSIYIAPGFQGRGVGKDLLRALLVELLAVEIREVVALIGDSANMGSIRLHQSVGFERVGLLSGAGWKFGKWLDVVIMQRSLTEELAAQK